MSTLITTKIKHPSSADDNFTLNQDGSVTVGAGGSAAGYQSGKFLPDIRGDVGAGSIWMENGVPKNSFIAAGYAFDWWRIGDSVTANVNFTTGVAGAAGDTTTLVVTNLPYACRKDDTNPGAPYYIGTMVASKLLTADSGYETIAPTIYNGGNYSGYEIYFSLGLVGTSSIASLKCNIVASGASFYFQLTYQTDDTTWKPSNNATLS